MNRFIHSIQFSLKIALKAPLNTCLCILVLAGGIALTASMFRLEHMVLFTRLPYRDANRIVIPERQMKDSGEINSGWGFHSARYLQENSKDIFEDVIPEFSDRLSLEYGNNTASKYGSYIYWDFLRILGRKPAMGRAFTSEDQSASAPPVVILSWKIWQQMGGDSDMIGKSIIVDNVSRTVVGIMPDDFQFPFANELWLPLNLDTLRQQAGWASEIFVVAYVRNGVSISVLNRRLSSLAVEINKEFPNENEAFSANTRLQSIQAFLFDSQSTSMITALFICSIIVLLMGCGLVSGLMTARYSARTQEIAVRSAMGASRMQIARQMVAEFSIIALCATAMGLLLHKCLEAGLLGRYYERFNIPKYMLETGTGPMLGMVVITILVVTFASSLLPSLRASRTNLGIVLRESTRTGSSLRVTRVSNFIIVWQVAMAFAVLCAGIETISYLRNIRDYKGYYNPADYLSADLGFNAKNHGDNANRGKLCNRIARHLNELPEVEAAGLTTEFLSGNNMGNPTQVWITGESYSSDADVPRETLRVITPGYFKALNIPLLEGRDFNDDDDADNTGKVIVTDTFARKYFNGTDAIGRKLRLGKNSEECTVVGVVADTFASDRLNTGPETGLYTPLASQPWFDVVLFAKMRTNGTDGEKILFNAIREVDNNVSVSGLVPMNIRRNQCKGTDFMEFLIAIFTTLATGALLMAGAGLYGIISFSTNMKKVEMGIRMALGASPLLVLRMVTLKGVVLTITGLVIGLPCSILLGRVLAHGENMHGVSSSLITLAIILPICFAAVFFPAFRTVAADPTKSLREQ